jgi:hypothetical protein
VQAHQLQQDLQKIRRRFGRQCRGIGKVFVTLVRQTETQLLERGAQVLPLARFAQARLDTQFTAALEAHYRIATPSRRLTQGKALPHCKIVNAYDPTITPICCIFHGYLPRGPRQGCHLLQAKPAILGAQRRWAVYCYSAAAPLVNLACRVRMDSPCKVIL